MNPWQKKAKILGLALIILVFSWGMARNRGADSSRIPFQNSSPAEGYLSQIQLLDDTFRIDIKTIDVLLTYRPESFVVEGEAKVAFVMRSGQVRPLIHFDPAVRGHAVTSVRLNDETLDFNDPADVKMIEFPNTTQKAIEFQRDLSASEEHELNLRYTLIRPNGYPRFSTEVNDMYGRGNEEIFPTINVPHELARHRITLRVASAVPYRCIGSGLVQKTSSAPQEWLLDTEREVASYTIMFALLPEADTLLEEQTIAGIPVRILAFKGGASIPQAIELLTPWLPQITREMGPFPMPRGLSVFLVTQGGGMEYFGATITSVWALEHEVFHMYFACSTIARTYRDSWWDEAITSWYQETYTSTFVPMSDDYRSNMVSGRSPIAVGFDMRAYYEGAQIIEAMAQQVGGREPMIRFLSLLHRTHLWSPFDTLEMAEIFRQYSGVDMRSRFINWLYMGQAPDPLLHLNELKQAKTPDLTPPPQVLHRYGLDEAVEKKVEK